MGIEIPYEEYTKLRKSIENRINRIYLEKYLRNLRKDKEAIRQGLDIIIEWLIGYYYSKQFENEMNSIYSACIRSLDYGKYIGLKEIELKNKEWFSEFNNSENYIDFFRIICLDNDFSRELPKTAMGLISFIKKHLERIGINVNAGNSNESSFNFLRASEIEKEDIKVIGNRKALKMVKLLLLFLLSFDTEKGFNNLRKVISFPYVIDLYGPPGTGKTYLLKYAEQFLRKAYEKTGKDTFIKYITMGEFSSYINKSAKNIENLFQTIKEKNYRFIIFIDEFETMFFSSKSNEEDAKVIGVLRRILGDTSNEKGNWAMIITSNEDLSTTSRLEEQIKSRLKGGAVYVPGVKSLDEYIELFKYKARKGLEYKYFNLNEEDIKNIAEEMYKLKFSGREVEKVIERASFLVLNCLDKNYESLLNKNNKVLEFLSPIGFSEFISIIKEIQGEIHGYRCNS